MLHFRLSVTGAEPVTRAEAKLAARVDDDLGAASSLDGLVDTYIATAREDAEGITGRCYRPQVLRIELQDWPAATDMLPVYRAAGAEVRYWSGVNFVLLSGSAFDFAPGGPGGAGTVVAPTVGSSWPALGVRAIGHRVQIDLTAGPDSPDDVPACVKTYILASVAAWIDNPGALADGRAVANPMFEPLLKGEKLFR